MTIEMITPELAAAMLGNNPNNRNIKGRRVAAYARDMAAGHWRLVGDPIRIAKDESLLDGQHRLAAVVMSGKSIECDVIRNMDKSAILCIDGGIPRSFRDLLKFQKEENTSILATIASLAWKAMTGSILTSNTSSTIQERMAVIRKYPSLRESASWAAGVKDKCYLTTSSTLAFTHWAYRQAGHQEEVLAFWEAFSTANALRNDDPAFVLREQHVRDAKSNMKRPIIAKLALTIKAINIRAQGGTCRLLRWSRYGSSSVDEEFPTVLDFTETWKVRLFDEEE